MNDRENYFFISKTVTITAPDKKQNTNVDAIFFMKVVHLRKDRCINI